VKTFASVFAFTCEDPFTYSSRVGTRGTVWYKLPSNPPSVVRSWPSLGVEGAKWLGFRVCTHLFKASPDNMQQEPK
jgi:hypothetical protein